MDVHPSDDRVVSSEPTSPVEARREWTAPAVTLLPKLTELTLLSPIGGGGGIGGSTVFGLLLAAGLLFGISACADQNLNRPSLGGNFIPAAEQLTCHADVRAESFECAATGGASRSPGIATFGEQGVKVGLRSSNTLYNPGTRVFSADVSVQNEAAFAMGTADGTTQDSGGIKVFFLAQPTGDVGLVSVANPAGTATFTASNQPYFKYDTLLTSQQVSNTQTWQFQLDPSTASFTFQVLVSAELPNKGAILHWVLEPGINPINWEGVSGWGFVGLAVFGQTGEVFVQDSGVWHSYTDPLGSGPGGSSLNNQVVAAGRNDLTFDNGSRFRHWDGISWRTLDSLPNSPGLMTAIGPTGGLGGVWGLGFRLARFSGSSWISDTLPTSVSRAVASTIFGTDLVILSSFGHVWRQNSSTGVWTEIGGPSGSGQTQQPGIIFASDANNVWTISTTNNTDPVIRYWNGSSWATQADPSGQDNNTGVPLGGVAFSSTDAYIVRADNVGHGHIWHWDGANWTDVHTAAYNYTGIWARGNDDFFVSEEGGRVEEYNSGTWSFVLDNTPPTTAVWVESSTSAYMATNTSEILHYNGSTWSFAVSTAGTYTSIWESGPNDIWVARSDNALVHKDASSWTVVGPGGPGPYYGVGGSGAGDIWTVGHFGEIYHYNGSTWSSSVAEGDLTFSDLYAVWAANANFAVAVGQSGEIDRWNGTSWAQDTTIGSLSFRSVWGTSPSDVWAVGDGGEIVHYDGLSWSSVTSGTGQNLRGVWASSASEAYAVGDNKTVLMYNGTSWSPVSVQSSGGSTYNAISGVPGGQALIAGDRVLRGTR